jgi:hypothetical protein
MTIGKVFKFKATCEDYDGKIQADFEVHALTYTQALQNLVYTWPDATEIKFVGEI